MKIRNFAFALALSVISVSASAGVVTLYQSSAPLTISSNNNNVVPAQSVATTGLDILVSLSLKFAGTIDNNDFVAFWFGYDAAGTSNDKNVAGDHTSGPNIGIKGNGGNGGSTSDLFVRNTGTGGNWLTGSNLLPGTEYVLFAHLYKSVGSGTYDRLDAWLNPTLDEKTTLTGADVSTSANSGLPLFNVFGFRSANLDGGDVITVSNVTVQAIPEPATLALAAFGLFGIAGLSYRRKPR